MKQLKISYSLPFLQNSNSWLKSYPKNDYIFM
jgi:hypothetical protein